VVGHGVVTPFSELDGDFEIVVGVELLVDDVVCPKLRLKIVPPKVTDSWRDVDCQAQYHHREGSQDSANR